MRYLEPDLEIKTFSYIADDKKITEETWVDKINDFTKALPKKVYATEKSLESDLDKMVLSQGEPFGSTSIHAQYRVFESARDAGIKVTLDGQGADELLAGYVGYPGQRFLSLIEKGQFKRAKKFIKSWSGVFGDKYFHPWRYTFRLLLPDKVYLVARKFMGRDAQPDWLKISSMKEAGVKFSENRYHLKKSNRGQRVKEALALSLQHRGLPSLLRHGDRNSMAFSIESRVPFLTIPLAEFLLSLPEEYLISDDGTTKHIFREAMRGIVPDSHLDRKDKIGYETPQSDWLLNMSGVIKKWIDDAPEISFINKDVMLQEFDEVVEGKRPFDQRVWRWVNYLRWYSLIGAES
jgi:asparagine synthase (glutamine-hydrolysing)